MPGGLVVRIMRTITYVADTVLAATGAVQISAAASPAAAHADFSRCGYSVTTDGARLRSGPGSTSTVLGLLREGDSVSADQANGHRYRVTLQWDSGSQYGTRKSDGLREGTTGWVAKKFLRADTCMQLD